MSFYCEYLGLWADIVFLKVTILMSKRLVGVNVLVVPVLRYQGSPRLGQSTATIKSHGGSVARQAGHSRYKRFREIKTTGGGGGSANLSVFPNRGGVHNWVNPQKQTGRGEEESESDRGSWVRKRTKKQHGDRAEGNLSKGEIMQTLIPAFNAVGLRQVGINMSSSDRKNKNLGNIF